MKTASHVAILGVVLILSGSAVSGREIKASEPLMKCCDDLAQHGFTSSRGGDVCAAVKIQGSKCKASMSWKESKEACESIGARLCKFDEVESRVLKGLGCSEDDHDDAVKTWTDERCIYDFETGSNGYLAYTEDGREQYCLSKAKGKAQLACCADPCASSSSTGGKPREAIVKSCAELKKDFPFEHIGDHTVCAATSVEKNENGDWVCGADEPWESAQNKCEAIGARLCTGDEFLQSHYDLGEGGASLLGVGCDLGDALMWTSERCVSDWMTGENGYLAAAASDGEFLACLAKKGGRAKIACCADDDNKRDSKHSRE